MKGEENSTQPYVRYSPAPQNTDTELNCEIYLRIPGSKAATVLYQFIPGGITVKCFTISFKKFLAGEHSMFKKLYSISLSDMQSPSPEKEFHWVVATGSPNF